MQDTIAPEVVTAKRPGLVTRARARVATIVVIVAAAIVSGLSPASATTPSTDLTDGAGDTFFTTITSYFTANVLPSVLILLALMVGVGVLIKWGKRAAKSS